MKNQTIILVIHIIKVTMYFFDRLYGIWKSDTYSQYPMLMRKKADIQKKSKAIMQRISKENVKPTSRKIGKVTNSSPVLLFDYVSILKSTQCLRSVQCLCCNIEIDYNKIQTFAIIPNLGPSSNPAV